MNNVIFRSAAATDLPNIVALLADDELGSRREDATIPVGQEYVSAFAAVEQDPNQNLLVVEVHGQIIGCLQLTFIAGLSRRGMWRGQIESVRVANSYRGKGLGREMLEWAVNECRERGCGLVQLTTDKQRTDSIDFYVSLGFTASHEGMKLSL